MTSLPRQLILYPKHLNLYSQCPERYYHERVERRRTEKDSSVALVRGIAVHQALSDIARDYETFYRQEGVPGVPGNLKARAEQVLRRESYPCDDAWASDVATLVEELRYGTSYLDGEARVLATEVTLQYPYGGSPECPPFTLATKVDLILRRHTDNGEPYLDVIDWKGGSKLRGDPIQELAARMVVKHNAARLHSGEYSFIQSTTVFLGAKTHRSTVIGAVDGPQRWTELKTIAAAIQSGSDWAPNPSPLCEWCPFFGNGCTLAEEVTPSDDAAEWLDVITLLGSDMKTPVELRD